MRNGQTAMLIYVALDPRRPPGIGASSELNKIWALRGDDILAAKQNLRPSQAGEGASPA